MARQRYCDCGRKILTRIKGKYKQSRDNDHVLCRQCWQAERDREREVEKDDVLCGTEGGVC